MASLLIFTALDVLGKRKYIYKHSYFKKSILIDPFFFYPYYRFHNLASTQKELEELNGRILTGTVPRFASAFLFDVHKIMQRLRQKVAWKSDNPFQTTL